MEFQEPVNEEEDDQDLEMDTAEDPSKESSQPKIFKGSGCKYVKTLHLLPKTPSHQ